VAAVMMFPVGLFPMSRVSFSQTRSPSSGYRILLQREYTVRWPLSTELLPAQATSRVLPCRIMFDGLLISFSLSSSKKTPHSLKMHRLPRPLSATRMFPSFLISIEANTGPGLRLQVKPEDLTTKSGPYAEGVHC